MAKDDSNNTASGQWISIRKIPEAEWPAVRAGIIDGHIPYRYFTTATLSEIRTEANMKRAVPAGALDPSVAFADLLPSGPPTPPPPSQRLQPDWCYGGLSEVFWRVARTNNNFGVAVAGDLVVNGVEILIRGPTIETSATPTKLPQKELLAKEVARRKAAGEKVPATCAELARDLERWMVARAKSDKSIKPLNWRTLVNYLPKWKLWPVL
jgi:hypothetical protein